MAFKKPTIHKIKPDINNASIYLRGESKLGKSSLFRDVILQKFGDPSAGLLIKCGAESGDSMLDEVNSVQVENWSELTELISWLIEEKEKEHNIEICALDTVDELIKMAEEEAIKISYKESREAGKPVKPRSINQAFGGFGKGSAYVVNALLTPLIGKLKSHFGLWCIAHTKMKVNTNKVDSLNEETAVKQLTSNLDSRYEACLSGLLDIIVTGTFENDEVVGTAKVGMINSEKEVSLVDPTKQKRVLYFRSTPLVDAGSRFADFADIPESMELKLNQNNAKTFIEIVELGMEKSKIKYRHYNNNTKEMKKEESSSEVIPQENNKLNAESLLQQVAALYKTCTDKKIKEQVKEITKGSLNKNTPLEALQESLRLLNK